MATRLSVRYNSRTAVVQIMCEVCFMSYLICYLIHSLKSKYTLIVFLFTAKSYSLFSKTQSISMPGVFIIRSVKILMCLICSLIHILNSIYTLILLLFNGKPYFIYRETVFPSK